MRQTELVLLECCLLGIEVIKGRIVVGLVDRANV